MRPQFYNGNQNVIEKQYYVYAYCRKSNGTPYYIGKGTGNRMFEHHGRVQVPANKRFIVMLEGNLTELGALALERRYIKWWGRKDIDTGVLLNKTDGGDGVSGLKMSDESKALMRLRKEGFVPWHAGKTGVYSAETLRVMSQKKQGVKPWNTGKTGVYSEEALNAMRQKKLGLFQKYKWWNNGQISTRAEQQPGDEWVLGRVKK